MYVSKLGLDLRIKNISDYIVTDFLLINVQIALIKRFLSKETNRKLIPINKSQKFKSSRPGHFTKIPHQSH